MTVESPTQRWDRLVERTDTCWIWTGSRNNKGYGRFFDGTRTVLAHRWAYLRFVGPIPDGLTVDHTCRNTSCVNPTHLRLLTRKRNAWLASTNKDKTHCKRDHELTPENTYHHPKRPQVRDCRTCRAERQAARRARTALLPTTP